MGVECLGSLSEQQEAILIEIMTAAIKQATTGEIPAGRQHPRKVRIAEICIDPNERAEWFRFFSYVSWKLVI